MRTFELISIVCILLITLASGAYPFFKNMEKRDSFFPLAESLATGVFLGVSLIHMLGSASDTFYHLSYHYPLAFLLAGAMFLFLLLLEHIGREVVMHKGDTSGAFAILATIMLSVHAFLMGTALGLSESFSIAAMLFLAIVAHKWAESFSLAVQINKSAFSVKTNIVLFLLFALMTPIGVVFGATAKMTLHHYPLLEPILSSLAAGTFLYLGTLHGLEKATLIARCCDLKHFYFVILGFAIMAVVAIWV